MTTAVANESQLCSKEKSDVIDKQDSTKNDDKPGNTEKLAYLECGPATINTLVSALY